MITRYIKGDIRDTELLDIAHGVNCMNAMGAGIARALFEKWPIVKEAYHAGWDEPGKSEAKWKLGTIQAVGVGKDKVVWNCFIQVNYYPRDIRNVNYAAIVKCFDQMAECVDKLAIPKIGCGLAGGDWNIVEQLINDTVGDRMEIWVYELDDKKD